jgi:hypothetical protein
MPTSANRSWARGMSSGRSNCKDSLLMSANFPPDAIPVLSPSMGESQSGGNKSCSHVSVQHPYTSLSPSRGRKRNGDCDQASIDFLGCC